MRPRTALPARDRALYSRLRQLLREPGLLRGNLVEMRRQCGKPSCGCHRQPARRHRSLYLGVSLTGRRRMIYIPPAWEGRVRQWAQRYARVRQALEQALRRLPGWRAWLGPGWRPSADTLGRALAGTALPALRALVLTR